MSKKILLAAAALVIAAVGAFFAQKPNAAFYMISANGQRLLIVEPAGAKRAYVHAYFPPDGERVRATRANVEVRCESGEQRRVSLALLADDGSVLDTNRRRGAWYKAKAGTPDDAALKAVCKPAEVKGMLIANIKTREALTEVRDVYLTQMEVERAREAKERAAKEAEAAKNPKPDMPVEIPYFPD